MGAAARAARRGQTPAAHMAGRPTRTSAQQRAPPPATSSSVSDMLAARVRAASGLGDEHSLRELDGLPSDAAHPSEWASAPRYRGWSHACVALLDGRLDDARVLLEPMAHDIERYRYFAAAQARVMLADIHAPQSSFDAAVATLRPWLGQARRSGEIGGALFAGPQVLRRLSGATGGRLTPAERGQLDSIAACRRPPPPRPAVRPMWGRAGRRRAGRRHASPGAHRSAWFRRTQRARTRGVERIRRRRHNKLIARAFRTGSPDRQAPWVQHPRQAGCGHARPGGRALFLVLFMGACRHGAGITADLRQRTASSGEVLMRPPPKSQGSLCCTNSVERRA